MAKAKDYLKYELQDGKGEDGGIAYVGETLEDFLSGVYPDRDIEEMDMQEVNKVLELCGIERINNYIQNIRLIDADRYINDNVDYFDSCYGSAASKLLKESIGKAPKINAIALEDIEKMVDAINNIDHKDHGYISSLKAHQAAKSAISDVLEIIKKYTGVGE